MRFGSGQVVQATCGMRHRGRCVCVCRGKRIVGRPVHQTPVECRSAGAPAITCFAFTLIAPCCRECSSELLTLMSTEQPSRWQQPHRQPSVEEELPCRQVDLGVMTAVAAATLEQLEATGRHRRRATVDCAGRRRACDQRTVRSSAHQGQRVETNLPLRGHKRGAKAEASQHGDEAAFGAPWPISYDLVRSRTRTSHTSAALSGSANPWQRSSSALPLAP